MPRFEDRKSSRLFDVIDRFEGVPSSTHCYNALGAIERLKEDGAAFWDEDSPQLRRWREACTTLWVFLNTLGNRRYEDLATVLREFIQEFEHSTERMYQMLYSRDDPDEDPVIARTCHWFDLVYRLSTYALISSRIDDKREDVSARIEVNLATRKTTQEITRNEMKVPKKYRRATKKL